MAELSDMTGGGVSGVIPGYTLNRLNNGAIAEVEEGLQRQHVEKVGKYTVGLAPALRKEVISQAMIDASHYVVYGTPHFAMQTSGAGASMLSLLASARINTPQLNEADFTMKVNNLPVEQVRQAVDWVWSRDPATLVSRKKTRYPVRRRHWRDERNYAEPVRWDKVFAELFKKRPSLTYQDAAAMTPKQMAHALGWADREPTARESQYALLDEIADELDQSPMGLIGIESIVTDRIRAKTGEALSPSFVGMGIMRWARDTEAEATAAGY